MTTKPPPSTAAAPADSLEHLAYKAVQSIPGREPNDVNRLGYNVWAWLKERKGSLDDAVKSSGVRTEMDHAAIVASIKEYLRANGVSGV